MAKLDSRTAELPGLPPVPKKRGRPATGQAKPPAQRMAEYRARRVQEVATAKSLYRRTSLKSLLLTIETQAVLVLEDGTPDLDELEVARAAWLEIGRRYGWKMP